ncbi:MAG: ABC transporter ATP-binding protein [Candidatus Andersenbacteria bacterium]
MRLWTYLKQHRRALIGALVAAAVSQLLSMLDPQIFRILIDRYATHAADFTRTEFLQGLVYLGAAYLSVGVGWRVIDSFESYLIGVVTQRVGASLYARSVAHAFALPFAVFEDTRSGELLQKLQKARDDTRRLIESGIDVVFLTLLTVVIVVAYAFTLDWRVGALYGAIIPIVGIAAYYLTRAVRKSQEAINRELADLAGSTTETLRNVELTKSLGLVAQEVGRLNTVNDRVLALELKKLRLVRVRQFWLGTIFNAVRVTLILVMVWLVFEGSLTVGELFSLSVYTFFIFGPLNQFSSVATQYQEAKASNAAVEQVMDTPPEPKPAAPRRIGSLERIDLEQVHFRYGSGTREALAGISLHINAGETIAFVGPSGSGKTTIVKLLVGLYRPTGGQLRYNGINFPEIDLEAFRQRIGLVTQETQLFAGTIRENLLFVRPDASEGAMRHALEQAAAVPIVKRGDRGLDTKIGEGGLKLSGGERQRLAIARALLRDPELIIFDEATSSLDSLTERDITATIRDLERARTSTTTVLVAHRLSTILHAQRIYVLEQGRVVETGTHDALVKAGGLYAALWREQSGGTA